MPKAEKMIGAVDIGGTKIQVGLLKGNGEFLGSATFPTNSMGQTGDEAVGKIADALKKQCGDAGASPAQLQGIGVFCAGPVDPQRGTIENPYTLPGWEDYPLVARLSAVTGLPVKLDNDANGALLGEVFARGLSGQRVLMVTLGTGVGAAFWNGNELHRAGRYHPEMGHILVTGRGPECYCGHRGCFESLCSGRAINERCLAAGYTDFETLLAHAGGREAQAQALLEEILSDFRRGIWALKIIFKPDVLVLAGGFSKAHFSVLRDVLTGDNENRADFTGTAVILPESDVPNVALMGACMLPWDSE